MLPALWGGGRQEGTSVLPSPLLGPQHRAKRGGSDTWMSLMGGSAPTVQPSRASAVRGNGQRKNEESGSPLNSANLLYTVSNMEEFKNKCKKKKKKNSNISHDIRLTAYLQSLHDGSPSANTQLAGKPPFPSPRPTRRYSLLKRKV